MEKVQSPFSVFFDEWLNAQKNVINNFTNFQQSYTNGNGHGSTNGHTANPWKDWFGMQQGWVENFQKFFPGASQTEMGGNAQLKDWLEAQTSFMNNYLNSTKSFVETLGDSEKTAEFYKQFSEFQMKMLQNMLEQAKFFTNQSNHPTGNFMVDVFGLYERWKDLYTNALGALSNTANTVFTGPSSDIMRDTLSRVMGSSNTYLKLFEFLMPIFNAIQHKNFNIEQYQDLLDPSRYKKLLDKVFEFATPETVQEFFNHFSNVNNAINTTSQKSIQRFNELVEKNIAMIPNLAGGDPSTALKMYENALKAYQQTYEPFLKIPMEGKEAAIMHIMNQMQDKISEYLTLQVRYRYLMYNNGQEALETMMDTISQRIKDGNEIETFQDLFRIWVDSNENTFINYFHTEEFAKLQGELIEKGLQVKADFDKIIELLIAEYPVATRSEIDELAKTVYDIDSKLHALTKQVDQPVKETKTTSSKKSTTKSEA